MFSNQGNFETVSSETVSSETVSSVLYHVPQTPDFPVPTSQGLEAEVGTLITQALFLKIYLFLFI
jgi:hypothetical protein